MNTEKLDLLNIIIDWESDKNYQTLSVDVFLPHLFCQRTFFPKILERKKRNPKLKLLFSLSSILTVGLRRLINCRVAFLPF
jgi:hypothetical protein